MKADQIKSEQLLDKLSKEEGYVERSPEEVQQLSKEADRLNEEAKQAEALAQEERKKPRAEWNRAIIDNAQKARETATAKSNEFIRAKQIQQLQQNVSDRDKTLQSNAVESMKRAEAAAASNATAADNKKLELKTAQQERVARGEQSPSEQENKLAAELKDLEAKRDASKTVLTTAQEVRQSLEDLKKEFPIPTQDKALATQMIPQITEQLRVIEERIAAIDPSSKVVGDSDRLTLLLQLRRRLRAELSFYKKV